MWCTNDRHVRRTVYTAKFITEGKLANLQSVVYKTIVWQTYLLDNIFIRFGTKLYGKNIDIPMGTNCAPLVADLFLFCYERDFMKLFSPEIRLTLSMLSISLQDTLMIY